MSVVRWVFFDPIASASYTFDINPNEGGSPGRSKTVSYQATAAPDGLTLIFEGREEARKISFSGTILVQAHYDAFESWFTLKRQIRLTDDLGRQYWIYLTSWQPKRVRSAIYPWKHTYEISATILDNP